MVNFVLTFVASLTLRRTPGSLRCCLDLRMLFRQITLKKVPWSAAYPSSIQTVARLMS